MHAAKHLFHRILAACVLASLVATSGSAGAGEPAKACTDPPYSQFDFWLGEWEVSEGGKAAGRNAIVKILGGCVLQESWVGASGMAGHSYTLYDQARRRWHQTWVDASGGLLQLDGGLVGRSMVLEGVQVDAPTSTVTRERIRWTPSADGSVRQLWEYSGDGGRTWKPRFDGQYRPRAPQ